MAQADAASAGAPQTLPPSNHSNRPPASRMMDVWSRSGSKYRIRAVILLSVNVLLFAEVGSFAFWLRSGERFAPIVPGYWGHFVQTFRFAGDNPVSLGSLLLDPISVLEVPMQIPILGLLMAALISIPILVAILYRFWASLPFIVVVGFLAVMPWLALTLLLSCILASVWPFRTRYRFMSALMGLVPVVIYLTLAYRGSTDIIAGRVDPIDGIKFVAPWVLAVVAAAGAFAVVLMIARIVDYRPGAIAPLLAVMFVLPAALFEFKVGRDELYYRLLEALNRAHFAESDASVAWRESAWRAYQRHPLPRPPWQVVRQIEEQKWLFELATELGPYESELTRHQATIAQRCDWFITHFPKSRYAANALFIKARALDTRVDVGEFRRTKWVRFYDDFPTAASRETWLVLSELQPDSILGAAAGLRLAQLSAREGSVDRAVSRLERVIAALEAHSPEGTADDPIELPRPSVLARGAPQSTLGISVEALELQARRLQGLLTANRDPLYGYEPLAGPRPGSTDWPYGLLDLDPRHERYAENLKRLKTQYPHCQIQDNIDLELAKATAAPESRIELLEACLKRFPDRDAAPETLLRLGMTYRETGQVEQSDLAFDKLLKRHPGSIWAYEVSQYWPHAARTRWTSAAP